MLAIGESRCRVCECLFYYSYNLSTGSEIYKIKKSTDKHEKHLLTLVHTHMPDLSQMFCLLFLGRPLFFPSLSSPTLGKTCLLALTSWGTGKVRLRTLPPSPVTQGFADSVLEGLPRPFAHPISSFKIQPHFTMEAGMENTVVPFRVCFPPEQQESGGWS